MAGSYQRIDYRLRPAKSVERKMLADAFRKLSEFGRLDAYRYIGFGSLYFMDFVLFHKLLGFKSMVSIENEEDATKQRRFDYNLPYKHVKMEFGSSSTVLPRLPWDVRSIVWLDYDGRLNRSVLQDIAYVVSKAVSGSMLLISANASLPSSQTEDGQTASRKPLDQLEAQIGLEKIPAGLQDSDLAGWNVAKILRSVIDSEIADTLVTVNRTRSAGAKLVYRQLFNFHYQDGARMLTVGGILYDEGQEANLAKCGFNQLDFFRDGDMPYKIETPLLTYKEMRRIDTLIPLEAHDFANIPIPESEIQKYIDFYRYLPHFAETEGQ